MQDLDANKTEILDKLAAFIVQRDLAAIAIFTLESTRPLHFLSAQALLFFEPLLGSLMEASKIQSFREAIEDKRYVEYFLNQIEKSNQGSTGGKTSG